MATRPALISVILPSYNHSAYVSQALMSIARQTYSRVELIVIDDGSSDESPRIIESTLRRKIFSRLERVEFVKQKNRGAHLALNQGLSLSRGSLLTILNSDDYFELSRLETLSRVVGDKKAQLGFTKVRHVDEHGDALSTDHPMKGWYDENFSKDFLTVGFRLLYSNVVVTTGNLFFTRGLYEKIGGFRDFAIMHDYDFVLRALFETEPAFVPEELLNYRAHGSNTCMINDHLHGSEAPRVAFEFFKSCIVRKRPPNRIAPCPDYWKERFLEFWENETDAWIGKWVGDPRSLFRSP